VIAVKGSGGIADKIKDAFLDDDRVKRIVETEPNDAVKTARKMIK